MKISYLISIACLSATTLQAPEYLYSRLSDAAAHSADLPLNSTARRLLQAIHASTGQDGVLVLGTHCLASREFIHPGQVYTFVVQDTLVDLRVFLTDWMNRALPQYPVLRGDIIPQINEIQPPERLADGLTWQLSDRLTVRQGPVYGVQLSLFSGERYVVAIMNREADIRELTDLLEIYE